MYKCVCVFLYLFIYLFVHLFIDSFSMQEYHTNVRIYPY